MAWSIGTRIFPSGGSTSRKIAMRTLGRILTRRQGRFALSISFGRKHSDIAQRADDRQHLATGGKPSAGRSFVPFDCLHELDFGRIVAPLAGGGINKLTTAGGKRGNRHLKISLRGNFRRQLGGPIDLAGWVKPTGDPDRQRNMPHTFWAGRAGQ